MWRTAILAIALSGCGYSPDPSDTKPSTGHHYESPVNRRSKLDMLWAIGALLDDDAPVPVPWAPSDIAGIFAWYHADDYSQSTLPRWGDNSLQGRSLAFAVGGVPDQGNATAIDGLRAQGFAGNDCVRGIVAAANYNFLHGKGSGGTLAIRFQENDLTGTHIVADTSTTAARNGFWLRYDATNQRFDIQLMASNVATLNINTGNGSATRGAPHTFVWRITTGGAYTVDIDGVTVRSGTTTPPPLDCNQPLTIGTWADGTSSGATTAFVRSVALWNTNISDADKTIVNTELAGLVSNRTTQLNLWLLGDSNTETTGWYEKFYAKVTDSVLIRAKADRIGNVVRAASNGAPAGKWDATSGWVLSQIQASVNATIASGDAANATHVVSFGGLNNVQNAHWDGKATYKAAQGALIDSIRAARPGLPYYILQMPPATAATHPPARIAEAVAADQELAVEKGCTWVDLGLVSVTDFQGDLLHINTTTGTDKVANGVAGLFGL